MAHDLQEALVCSIFFFNSIASWTNYGLIHLCIHVLQGHDEFNDINNQTIFLSYTLYRTNKQVYANT